MLISISPTYLKKSSLPEEVQKILNYLVLQKEAITEITLNKINYLDNYFINTSRKKLDLNSFYIFINYLFSSKMYEKVENLLVKIEENCVEIKNFEEFTLIKFESRCKLGLLLKANYDAKKLLKFYQKNKYTQKIKKILSLVNWNYERLLFYKIEFLKMNIILNNIEAINDVCNKIKLKYFDWSSIEKEENLNLQEEFQYIFQLIEKEKIKRYASASLMELYILSKIFYLENYENTMILNEKNTLIKTIHLDLMELISFYPHEIFSFNLTMLFFYLIDKKSLMSKIQLFFNKLKIDNQNKEVLFFLKKIKEKVENKKQAKLFYKIEYGNDQGNFFPEKKTLVDVTTYPEFNFIPTMTSNDDKDDKNFSHYFEKIPFEDWSVVGEDLVVAFQQMKLFESAHKILDLIETQNKDDFLGDLNWYYLKINLLISSGEIEKAKALLIIILDKLPLNDHEKMEFLKFKKNFKEMEK